MLTFDDIRGVGVSRMMIFSEWNSQFWFTVSFSSHWRGKNGPIYFALLKVTAYRGVELVNKVDKIL